MDEYCRKSDGDRAVYAPSIEYNIIIVLLLYYTRFTRASSREQTNRRVAKITATRCPSSGGPRAFAQQDVRPQPRHLFPKFPDRGIRTVYLLLRADRVSGIEILLPDHQL